MSPMAWWIWAVGGLVLLGIELAAPSGFYIIFFGIGAFLVALLVGIGLVTTQWLQWLIFTVSSIVALLLFRKPLLEKFKVTLAGKDVDNLIGQAAVAMEDLPTNGIGKVEMRGSAWNAKNVGPAAIPKGQRVRVEKIEGLMLSVRQE